MVTLPDAFDAIVLGVLQVVVDLRVEKQRLGGDAAPVEAGAAQLLVPLDERGLEPVLPGADGGGIPGGTSAENCDVINRFCQA